VKLDTNKNQPEYWWVQRWHTLLADYGIEPGHAPSHCDVQHIDIGNGMITARVAVPAADSSTQDAVRICTVEIRWPPLNDAEWQRIFDALSSQALFSAQLLAGEFPPEIERIFADADLSLLPESLREWRITHFSCADGATDDDSDADWQLPVAAAVYSGLGQMFRAEPWLIFELRGRTQKQILHALREHRWEPGPHARSASPATMEADERSLPFFPAHAQPENAHSALPIFDAENAASQVDEFWGATKRVKQLQYRIEPPAIDLALLRRLGPPPFPQASTEVYDHLAAIYRRVSEQALALAYATDPEALDEEDPG